MNRVAMDHKWEAELRSWQTVSLCYRVAIGCYKKNLRHRTSAWQYVLYREDFDWNIASFKLPLKQDLRTRALDCGQMQIWGSIYILLALFQRFETNKCAAGQWRSATANGPRLHESGSHWGAELTGGFDYSGMRLICSKGNGGVALTTKENHPMK